MLVVPVSSVAGAIAIALALGALAGCYPAARRAPGSRGGAAQRLAVRRAQSLRVRGRGSARVAAGACTRGAGAGEIASHHRPSERPMISFMISLVPP